MLNLFSVLHEWAHKSDVNKQLAQKLRWRTENGFGSPNCANEDLAQLNLLVWLRTLQQLPAYRSILELSERKYPCYVRPRTRQLRSYADCIGLGG
jgi:hypothetical protein